MTEHLTLEEISDQPEMEKYLTLKQIADNLQVEVTTLYKYTSVKPPVLHLTPPRPRLRGVRIGRRLRFKQRDIDTWLKELEVREESKHDETQDIPVGHPEEMDAGGEESSTGAETEDTGSAPG